MRIVTIGHTDWTNTTWEGHRDLRVAAAVAERLGGRHTLIVRDRLGRRRTFGDVNVVGIREMSRLSFVRRAVGEANNERDASLYIGSEPWGGAAALISARRAGAAWVLQVQGHVLYPGPEYGHRLRRVALGFLTRSLVRRADGVRALNDVLRDEVAALRPRGTVVTIGSRVDTTRFPHAEGVPRRPIVLVVGSCLTVKRQHIAVEAMATIRQQVGRARLYLVGDGPLLEDLRTHAAVLDLAPDVRFLGRIDHRTMPAVLAGAAVMLHPSASEGEPRAVLEAQAAGVAVIVSDIPGHRALVCDGETGSVIASADPQEWGRTAARLLHDRHLHRDMTAAARRQIEKSHSFDGNLDRIVAFYEEVMRL